MELEGLDDAALRTAMTPSGTSLLGLVKHQLHGRQEGGSGRLFEAAGSHVNLGEAARGGGDAKH